MVVVQVNRLPPFGRSMGHRGSRSQGDYGCNGDTVGKFVGAFVVMGCVFVVGVFVVLCWRQQQQWVKLWLTNSTH